MTFKIPVIIGFYIGENKKPPLSGVYWNIISTVETLLYINVHGECNVILVPLKEHINTSWLHKSSLTKYYVFCGQEKRTSHDFWQNVRTWSFRNIGSANRIRVEWIKISMIVSVSSIFGSIFGFFLGGNLIRSGLPSRS